MFCLLSQGRTTALASHPLLDWFTRSYCWIVTTARWVREGRSATDVKTSRRCHIAIISQFAKECEVIRKTIKTALTTHFIHCIKLSKMGRAEFEPVYKQVPTHRSLSFTSWRFVHISVALQGCGVTEHELTSNLSVLYSAVYSFRSCRNNHF